MKKFFDIAVKAARAAGALQQRGFGKTHRIEFKGEINLVTEVDKASEKKIVEIISKAFPDHHFLTEESGELVARPCPMHSARTKGCGKDKLPIHQHKKAFNDSISSDYQWIIDPLDGTTNYAHAFPSFCVSIALTYRQQVIVGVVYNPISKELFGGIRGQGAWLNGKRIQVSKIRNLKRSLLGTGFAYNVQVADNNNLNHLENFIKRAQGIRRMGAAALDICFVACGRLEGFWEMELWPWDIAAACVILEEAGGQATLFKGQPLDLHAKEIVASNGAVHAAMIDVIQQGIRDFGKHR